MFSYLPSENRSKNSLLSIKFKIVLSGNILSLRLTFLYTLEGMQEPKTFYIRTYGCQMNELDTDIISGQLQGRGMTRTYDEDGADLLIFNTCSIRDLAERKVMGKIGILGRSKKKALIGVTGCMANAKKDSLFRKLPHIDFVVGTNNIGDINEVLTDVVNTGMQSIRTDKDFEENLDYLVAKRDNPVKAHVSIIRGCDKFCTYCVVPYTRGKEVSRPADQILDEIKMLVDQGYKEVTLLGQNVNSWGKDSPKSKAQFHDLLARIDTETKIPRVRFMTSHPCDITLELMEAVRDLPSVCEFVHFPIQAGSSRILRKMHRIYTKEEYYEKVRLFREICPEVALGTDIIVGFPTETESEFQETVQVFRDIPFEIAFIYAYSPRQGTPAMRFKDDIPEEVKDSRLQELMALHRSQVAEKRRLMLGETVEVLFEKVNRSGQLKGRTRTWKKVICEGPESLIGTFGNVLLHSYNHETFVGTIQE